jgi:signal peptidase I
MVKIKKFIKYFLLIIGLLIITGAGFYFWQNNTWKKGINLSCVKIEEHNISGHSMDPLLKNSEEVKGLTGYYNCNNIVKNQIIILKFKSRDELFVKNLVGLPGDEIEFVDSKIKLNGEILKNVQGEEYLFSAASQKIISIPLKDGKIPENRYLILGEEKNASAFDSRQFGFAEKEHLTGRVIKETKINLINFIKEKI